MADSKQVADTILRPMFEQEVFDRHKPEVARGLGLKNSDGSFQVSSIEMEFRAWANGYRAALARSQPLQIPLQRYFNSEFGVEKFSNVQHKNMPDVPTYYLAADVDALIASRSQPHTADAVSRGDLVPGKMRCAKCDFSLLRTTLNVATGNAYAGDSKTEPCPNGCGPLWPMTWEQEAREGYKLCDNLFERAKAAEDALASRSQPQGEPVAHHGPDGKAAIAILRRAMTLAGVQDVTRGMLTLHFSNEWNKAIAYPVAQPVTPLQAPDQHGEKK